jgi:hypothetical protein
MVVTPLLIYCFDGGSVFEPSLPVYGLRFGFVDQLFAVLLSGVVRRCGGTYTPFFVTWPRTFVLADFPPVPGPEDDLLLRASASGTVKNEHKITTEIVGKRTLIVMPPPRE